MPELGDGLIGTDVRCPTGVSVGSPPRILARDPHGCVPCRAPAPRTVVTVGRKVAPHGGGGHYVLGETQEQPKYNGSKPPDREPQCCSIASVLRRHELYENRPASSGQ